MQNISEFSVHIITRPSSVRFFMQLPVFNKKDLYEVIADGPIEEPEKAIDEKVVRPLMTKDHITALWNFHSKFYAGVFSTHAEVLHTSFNLFQYEERELEDISVSVVPRRFFFERFLQPFGIRELVSPPDSRLEELTRNVEVLAITKNDSAFKSEIKEYDGRIWQLILRGEQITYSLR